MIKGLVISSSSYFDNGIIEQGSYSLSGLREENLFLQSLFSVL